MPRPSGPVAAVRGASAGRGHVPVAVRASMRRRFQRSTGPPRRAVRNPTGLRRTARPGADRPRRVPGGGAAVDDDGEDDRGSVRVAAGGMLVEGAADRRDLPLDADAGVGTHLGFALEDDDRVGGAGLGPGAVAEGNAPDDVGVAVVGGDPGLGDEFEAVEVEGVGGRRRCQARERTRGLARTGQDELAQQRRDEGGLTEAGDVGVRLDVGRDRLGQRRRRRAGGSPPGAPDGRTGAAGRTRATATRCAEACGRVCRCRAREALAEYDEVGGAARRGPRRRRGPPTRRRRSAGRRGRCRRRDARGRRGGARRGWRCRRSGGGWRRVRRRGRWPSAKGSSACMGGLLWQGLE